DAAAAARCAQHELGREGRLARVEAEPVATLREQAEADLAATREHAGNVDLDVTAGSDRAEVGERSAARRRIRGPVQRRLAPSAVGLVDERAVARPVAHIETQLRACDRAHAAGV